MSSSFGDSSDEDKAKGAVASSAAAGADKKSDESSGFGSDDEDKPPPTPAPRGRRRSSTRRCGVMTSTDDIVKDLEKKYAQMEEMVDTLEVGETELRQQESTDTKLVRSLTAMEFINFLRASGVPVQDYGKMELKTKPAVALWLELIFKKCDLERIPDASASGPSAPRLKRTLQMMFLEVEVLIGSERRFLILKDSVDDGKTRGDLNQRPSVKMFADEELEDAAWRCLVLNLNVAEKFCWQHFDIVSSSSHAETKISAGFPGIFTVYNIHVAHIKVKDPAAASLADFGLPRGTQFTRQLTKGMSGAGPNGAASRAKSWKWCSHDELMTAKAANAGTLIEPAPASGYEHGKDLMQEAEEAGLATVGLAAWAR